MFITWRGSTYKVDYLNLLLPGIITSPLLFMAAFTNNLVWLISAILSIIVLQILFRDGIRYVPTIREALDKTLKEIDGESLDDPHLRKFADLLLSNLASGGTPKTGKEAVGLLFETFVTLKSRDPEVFEYLYTHLRNRVITILLALSSEVHNLEEVTRALDEYIKLVNVHPDVLPLTTRARLEV